MTFSRVPLLVDGRPGIVPTTLGRDRWVPRPGLRRPPPEKSGHRSGHQWRRACRLPLPPSPFLLFQSVGEVLRTLFVRRRVREVRQSVSLGLRIFVSTFGTFVC